MHSPTLQELPYGMDDENVALEYRRHKDLREEDIQSLKEWYAKQVHLPPISEMHLIVFLHSCYWSIERAKSTLERFFTYRKAWPEFFAGTDPRRPKMLSDMEVVLYAFLPKRTPENYRVFYIKLLDHDLSRYVLKDQLKIMDMVLVVDILRSGTSDGLVIVCDFEDATVGHVLKTHVTEVKKFLTYLQEALPVRLKGLYYTNLGPIADLFKGLIKPLINKKLLECLHFTDSFEGVLKFVPQECFPKEFGGTAPSIYDLHVEMQDLLLSNVQFFIETEKMVTDESRRDRRPSYMDRDLGIGAVGSFKQLEFD
ncbi:hypothetical protein PPYR_03169 [Photinus pyralis]|uniref:CRAL-TRIO domain-containing protein n=2 Tax=Photinus pyralis TaxID=7054 RepID=A0A5N4A256_PHOPY|nr:hypothetical protein PPYR_03169 [Photinus pyralis]